MVGRGDDADQRKKQSETGQVGTTGEVGKRGDGLNKNNTSSKSSVVQQEQVYVHPLVLLSVVDHYNRVAKDTKKRSVGIILGERRKGGIIEVTNSFAVPFEEDEKNPSIWFLDHSYLENMYRMFKKVNAREKIIGWYHTGPRLRESDMNIHQLISEYCESVQKQAVLVICEVKPKDVGLPVHAYKAVEEVSDGRGFNKGVSKSKPVFLNLPTEVGATEAEEIGVEHLLRDVKDATVSSLSSQVEEMVTGLKGLRIRLLEIKGYLEAVIAGKMPVNNDIIKNLQDIFSLLPNLQMDDLVSSFAMETNDMMMAVYLASLVRSVVALHTLIDNKEARMNHNVVVSEKVVEKNTTAKSA
jgi:26S proteasome regulatory subunit N8